MILSILLCSNVVNDRLIRTVRSCIDQVTQFEFEIVVVCNGPNRKKIITTLDKKFDAPNIKKIDCELTGLIASLNVGLNYCAGEFIGRIDVGDICLPNRFQLQVEALQTDPNLAVVGGQIRIEPAKKRKIKYPLSNIQVYRSWKNPFAHPAVMYRKDFVAKVGGYKFPYAAEDYALWLELICTREYNFRNLSNEVIIYERDTENNHRKLRSAYYGLALYSLYLFIQKRELFLLRHFFRNLLQAFLKI